MVTKNFLNVLGMVLQSGSLRGSLIMRTINGNTKYLNGANHLFLSSPTRAVTLVANDAGISVGTGSTAPTGYDWRLEATLTSGISLSIAEIRYGTDTPGNPYVEYDITATNIGSEPVTIKEIGYKQKVRTTIYPLTYNGAGDEDVCLMDRTVLDTPVTIDPGDAGIITYKLRTIPEAERTIGGVKIVSFTYGSDEDIAAMLDAAIAGDIDLQADAHWQVGELRRISLGAFTGGNGVVCPAQTMYIAIASFEEYNGCGNVLQFDFADALSVKYRMKATGATAGGYGATEMYTTTLPALAEALPDWLKTRLKTFSVICAKGGTGSDKYDIETIAGNKLALRSATELFGTPPAGYPAEGPQAAYYMYGVNRYKNYGLNGERATWWERSPLSYSGFGQVGPAGSQAGAGDSTSAIGIAPFGCI